MWQVTGWHCKNLTTLVWPFLKRFVLVLSLFELVVWSWLSWFCWSCPGFVAGCHPVLCWSLALGGVKLWHITDDPCCPLSSVVWSCLKWFVLLLSLCWLLVLSWCCPGMSGVVLVFSWYFSSLCVYHWHVVVSTCDKSQSTLAEPCHDVSILVWKGQSWWSPSLDC